MNYKEFFTTASEAIKEATIAIWSSGEKSKAQDYRTLLEREPLMQDPLFNVATPWESDTRKFRDFTNLFDAQFIDAVAEKCPDKYQFPYYKRGEKSYDHSPYVHQAKSWDILLNQKKNLIIKSGTGSGKTECFMLPVLQDLMHERQKGVTEGIQALFLYPLNALIKSQQERMDAWCEAIAKSYGVRDKSQTVNYGMYNSSTPETGGNARKIHVCESRDSMRNKMAPQILFSNPTMLEYMLLRRKDTPVLRASQGKLRWIILDEAHTYVGAAATNLALQIKRIIDAFDTDISQIRFAVTSATIGNGSITDLKNFVAGLTGKDATDIEVIDGDRIKPAIPTKAQNDFLKDNGLTCNPTLLNSFCNDCDKVWSASEISAYFTGRKDILKGLDIVDYLADKQIVPFRAHFFVRAVEGVYTKFDGNSTLALTTYRKHNPGERWYEVDLCPHCGRSIIKAELTFDSEDYVRPVYSKLESATPIEQLDIDDNTISADNDTLGYFVKGPSTQIQNVQKLVYEVKRADPDKDVIDETGFQTASSYTACRDSLPVTDNRCPHCGGHINDSTKVRGLSLTGTLINQTVIPYLLELCPQMRVMGVVHNGQRYISFTDSRQGTARSTLLINSNVERNWTRSFIYHSIWNTPSTPLPLNTCLNDIQNENDFPVLKDNTKFSHAYPKPYAEALLIDQIGSRAMRGNSVESMGIAQLQYDRLSSVNAPATLRQYVPAGLADDIWRTFLKLCIDYNIRPNSHILVNKNTRNYLTQRHHQSFIYSWASAASETVIVNNRQVTKRRKRFPIGISKSNQIERPVLYVMILMGLNDINALTPRHLADIDALLKQAWDDLSRFVLTPITSKAGPTPADLPYILDLFDTAKTTSLKIIKNAWLCPATATVLDTVLTVYDKNGNIRYQVSPNIKGSLTPENLNVFKIPVKNAIVFPDFPYPNRQDSSHNPVSPSTIIAWANGDTNVRNLRMMGIWNDLMDRIILKEPIFLSAEHSAQQSPEELRTIEDKFKNGQINVLNCSTTMEAGVDIGQINVVTMTTVPPNPANYHQRAGRAGRRGEFRSYAFTICASSSVGNMAFLSPKWVLDKTRLVNPYINFSNKSTIQRNINAMLLGHFIRQIGGANILEDISSFLVHDATIPMSAQNYLQQLLAWSVVTPANQAIHDRVKSISNGTILRYASEPSLILEAEKLLRLIWADYDAECLFWTNESTKSGITQAYQNMCAAKLNSIQHQKLVAYLSEKGYIPSESIPNDIVELNLPDASSTYVKNVSRTKLPLYRALAEYAPGRQIVLDCKCYTVAGIDKNSIFRPQSMKEISKCPTCHKIYQDLHSTTCPSCSTALEGLFGGLSTQMIEPAGFQCNLHDTESRTVDTNRLSQVEATLLNTKDWENTTPNALAEIRQSEDLASIFYYNVGAGLGYCICRECGKAVPEFTNGGNVPSSIQDHFDILDENATSYCPGGVNPYRNVMIGGHFMTEFFELRLRDSKGVLVSDDSLMFTMGVALVNAIASALGIKNDEISFGYKKYQDFTSIFIFDKAKGGAGYARKASMMLDRLFGIIKNQLNGCSCSKACPQCLIDHNTQWHEEWLDKNKVLQWISMYEKAKVSVPAAISSLFAPGAQISPQPFNISAIFASAFASADINECVFFFSGDAQNWDTVWNEDILSSIRGNGSIVKMAISQDVDYNKKDNAKVLSQICNRNGLSDLAIYNNLAYTPLALVKKNTGTNTLIFGSSVTSNERSSLWGTGGDLYTIDNIVEQSILGGQSVSFQKLDSILMSEKTTAFRLKNRMITVFSLYDEYKKAFQQKSPQSWSLLSSVLNPGQKVAISYTDRYMASKMDIMLFAHFVHNLAKDMGIIIDAVDIQVLDNYNHQSPIYINQDIENPAKRAQVAIDCFSTVLSLAPSKITCTSIGPSAIARMQHARELVLDPGNGHTVAIRPDGGWSNGWWPNGVLYTQPYNVDFPIQMQNIPDGLLYTTEVQ